MAVWQREDEEATEHMMSDLPVHPQEGGMGPAEEQQRRTWIQTLTKEQFLEVDALVRHKWQQQRTTSPAWLQGLLPPQPLADFWRAEYYVCMTDFIKESQKEQDRVPMLWFLLLEAATQTECLRTQ